MNQALPIPQHTQPSESTVPAAGPIDLRIEVSRSPRSSLRLAMCLVVTTALSTTGCGGESVPPPAPPKPHLDTCIKCLKVAKQLDLCDEIKAEAQGFHWTRASVRRCCEKGQMEVTKAISMIDEVRAAGCPETELLMLRADKLSHFFLKQKSRYK
jgi:hypothetical protein